MSALCFLHFRWVVLCVLISSLSIQASTTSQELLKKIESGERKVFQELKTLSKKQEQLETDFHELQSKLEIVQAALLETQKNIERLSQERKQHEQDLSVRLKKIYLKGPESSLSLWNEPDTSYEKNKWMYLWVRSERQLFKDAQTHLVQERLANENQREQTLSLEQQKQSLKFKEEELDSVKQEKQNLLSLLKEQKQFYQKSMKEFEAAQKNLQTLVADLPSKVVSDRFLKAKGRLIWPLKGRLQKLFGAYNDETLKVKLYSKGIEISAPKGQNVVSVFDGKVVFQDWFEGYGKVMIVDHGMGFFTLYAHLSEFVKKRNDWVVVGEVLGKVGDTDSLKGPSLYFEVRKKGISEDPLPWLKR